MPLERADVVVADHAVGGPELQLIDERHLEKGLLREAPSRRDRGEEAPALRLREDHRAVVAERALQIVAVGVTIADRADIGEPRVLRFAAAHELVPGCGASGDVLIDCRDEAVALRLGPPRIARRLLIHEQRVYGVPPEGM